MSTRTHDRNPYFGKRVKNLRESYGLSQMELAEQLGIQAKFGIQTVSAWENSKREPSFNTLVNIANFFGVTTDYLLGITDEKVNNSQQILLVKINDLPENQKEALLKVIELLTQKE